MAVIPNSGLEPFIMKIGALQSDIIIKQTIWHNFDYGIQVD